jgi:putative ABC transport system ATP-binding protein
VKPPFIIVRSVTKTYRRGQRQITALQDVSFELCRGELALLVGPSGSGKTTLLNLIAALERPDCGQIVVGGSHITALSRSAAALYRNEQVGFIFPVLQSAPATYCPRKRPLADAPEAPSGSPPRTGTP